MSKEDEDTLLGIARDQAKNQSWPELKKDVRAFRQLRKAHPDLQKVDRVVVYYGKACEARVEKKVAEIREEGKYNVEYKLKVGKRFKPESLEEILSQQGTSLDLGFLETEKERLLTVHLHTNEPGKIEEILRSVGKIKGEPVVEDMEEQIRNF